MSPKSIQLVLVILMTLLPLLPIISSSPGHLVLDYYKCESEYYQATFQRCKEERREKEEQKRERERRGREQMKISTALSLQEHHICHLLMIAVCAWNLHRF
eukprot:GFUD01122659.1.p1 GENE.GFUD01122659.1~~GFUD01122659.1.p1  ORF type:complete len:101 (+),score=27.54 GFUD01122659.1:87-389(+)